MLGVQKAGDWLRRFGRVEIDEDGLTAESGWLSFHERRVRIQKKQILEVGPVRIREHWRRYFGPSQWSIYLKYVDSDGEMRLLYFNMVSGQNWFSGVSLRIVKEKWLQAFKTIGVPVKDVG